MNGFFHNFVCFRCRVTFKRANPDRSYACPTCDGPTEMIWRRFKSPPKRAAKQWEKVKLLVQNGFINGKNDHKLLNRYSIRYPTTLREAREFISQQREIIYAPPARGPVPPTARETRKRAR